MQAMTLTNVRDQMDKYSLETAGEYLAKACTDEAPVRNLLARDRDLQQVGLVKGGQGLQHRIGRH